VFGWFVGTSGLARLLARLVVDAIVMIAAIICLVTNSLIDSGFVENK